jgi:predicted GIY-YIG superfamily endonuclease
MEESVWKQFTMPDIIQMEIPIPHICGIYILYFLNGTIYIGQTENMIRRMPEHKRGSIKNVPKDYYKVIFIPAPINARTRELMETFRIKRGRARGEEIINRNGRWIIFDKPEDLPENNKLQILDFI